MEVEELSVQKAILAGCLCPGASDVTGHAAVCSDSSEELSISHSGAVSGYCWS